jgi:hypothetical protein
MDDKRRVQAKGLSLSVVSSRLVLVAWTDGLELGARHETARKGNDQERQARMAGSDWPTSRFPSATSRALARCSLLSLHDGLTSQPPIVIIINPVSSPPLSVPDRSWPPAPVPVSAFLISVPVPVSSARPKSLADPPIRTRSIAQRRWLLFWVALLQRPSSCSATRTATLTSPS